MSGDYGDITTPSGKFLAANGGFVGINHHGELSVGWDDCLDDGDLEAWTEADRTYLADIMIARWAAFKAKPQQAACLMAVTLRFDPPAYDGGRHLLKCGRVPVGAVFPPVGSEPGQWVWRCWITGNLFADEGRAKSELAAKNACLAAFRNFLIAADLTERTDT